MTEWSTHINYSFEDIQRYLQGKTPAAEMHAIEKAALQDPFLADAIEGYRETDAAKAAKHLDKINAGLFAEKQQSKVASFNNRTRWLNVAAVLIIIAGIALFGAYVFNNSNKQQRLAQVRKEPVRNAPEKDSSITTPEENKLTEKADTSLFIAENRPLKKVHQSLAKRKTEEKNVIADKDVQEGDKAEVAGVASSPPASVQQNEPAANSFTLADTQSLIQEKTNRLAILPPPVFSGKVVDENNNPIPGVTIESADKKAAAVTDRNGNFDLKKNDSLLYVTASAIGYDSQNMLLKQKNNNPIILKGSNSNLNEVAVTGYDTKQKKNFPELDSAMPVNGWRNFNNYVMTQLSKDTAIVTATNPSDLVELEFLIDNAGNPYDIKVTRSPNEQYSSKAVEILKNGPKWTKPSKKKKARVVINF
jgi:cytoskeletal protein RodZ